MVKQFEIYWIKLDPTTGSEINKTRPCVVISPNDMNDLSTVIVSPMTTKGKSYPTRVPVFFQKKEGYIVLDQIRTVDKSRLIRMIGEIDQETASNVLRKLQEIFS